MPDSLHESLIAVQRDMPEIQKDSLNPHFKNTYVSLDALMEIVLPVLNANELILLQFPSNVNGLPALKTSLIHAPTGDLIEDTMMLVLDKDNPQGQGSAITYARRYSLMSALGLVADEDDDGEKATRKRELTSDGPVDSSW